MRARLSQFRTLGEARDPDVTNSSHAGVAARRTQVLEANCSYLKVNPDALVRLTRGILNFETAIERKRLNPKVIKTNDNRTSI